MLVKSKKNLILLTIIAIITALIRLPFLHTLPPGGENALLLRFPSAISGVISILVFTLLVTKVTSSFSLGFISGIVLTFMPWHIEQSRVYSQAMLGLTVILSGLLVMQYFNSTFQKIFIALFIVILFYLLYPSFWLFSGNLITPDLYKYATNLFKLISVEFLFFKNDSFWWGGLRTLGTMLPSMLPFFLLGLFETVKVMQKKDFVWVIPFIFIWLIASAAPKFPEEREVFLISPYLALITAVGLRRITHYFRDGLIWTKIAIGLYALFIVYEHLLFFHLYTSHYSRRVNSEVPYAQRDF